MASDVSPRGEGYAGARCRIEEEHVALLGWLPDCRQPFRYTPERPTTGKVRVARNPPTMGKTVVPQEPLGDAHGVTWR